MPKEQEDSGLQLGPMRSPFPEKVDRVSVPIKSSVDGKDLEKIIEFGVEKGASAGIAISTKDIVINDLMQVKCRIPTCWGYNSSYFCPPRTATSEEMREIVQDYEWAILLSIPPPDEPDAPYDDIFNYMNRMKEIIGRTEVESQYTGYVDSMGFTGGPCSICGMFSPEWVQARIEEKKVPHCPLITRESIVCLQFYHCRPATQA